MKQIVFLFALLLLPLAASADAVEIDGIFYNLNPETKEAELTKNPNKYPDGYSGNVTIPSTVVYEEVTYNVVSVGNDAFAYCTELSSVSMPNTITSIGRSAFTDCYALASVTLPNNLTNIGKRTFERCSSLSSVTIPETVIYIDDYAFHSCSSLASITIPNSVEWIGYCTFSACSGLTSIIIGESVYFIDSRAFEGCNGLTSITIPKSVRTIGEGALGSNNLEEIKVAPDNPYFTINDGLLFTKDLSRLMRYPPQKEGNKYSIPSSVTVIEALSFSGCKKLTSIIVPNSIASIGYGAFKGCGLTTFNIPSTITEIAGELFIGCRDLSSIEIPNSVTSIGAYAFQNCKSLKTIVIPNSVNSVSTQAFMGCTLLDKIVIGSSVSSIGDGAFFNCAGLKEVYIFVNEPFAIGKWTFFCQDEETHESFMPDATLYVPAGTKALYEATDGWKEFANIVEMEAQDLEPVDGGEDISFGGADSEIDEETDLDGNVVGNVLYNIQPDNGQYNPVEGCIEVTKPMTDEEMEDLEGKDVFGEDVHDNYTGIVFKVPAGSGTITVEADALGAMTLKVKIGKQEPIDLIPVGKMKMKIPYTVDKPTYIYIYAGMMDPDAARGQNRAAATSKLKLYGIRMESTSGIADVMTATSKESVYALGGQRLATRQRGVNIVRMSDSTVRKVLVK